MKTAPVQTSFRDYDIVTDESAFKLMESVRKLMKDGWVPLGGVAVSVETYRIDTDNVEGHVWAQAMVLP